MEIRNITKKGWKHYSKNFLNLVKIRKSNKKMDVFTSDPIVKILGNGWTEIRSNLMPKPTLRKIC